MHSKDSEALVAMIVDAVRRSAVHYGLWFAEAVHQLGLEKALEAEREAGDRAAPILAARIAKALGMDASDGPAALLRGLDQERLSALLDALCVNWLALDGVWFQAVEGLAGMDDAKRVNDTCWSRFAPLEARRIMAMHGFPRDGGLETLKTALGLRLYSRVNEYEIVEETPDSFVFRIRQCRVQAARTRKGLAEYPCKTGGLVEYRTFAQAVDPRIRTHCLACPPDPHPAEWCCAWRFELGEW
ncbi:DUF6125 family protein [Desulfocurvibacter africanus]|uniref:DUF6125 family protein n=1 Tax=Desulfocurvibacter africanus TaxID=873 RepID=UPI00040F2820|nr:DUF6125 family protein [Desulfocurvibacter africanus]